MLVQPAPDLRVRDPHNVARLVGVGEQVDETDLDWHRLIACGDLVECSPEEAKAAAEQADAEARAADADAKDQAAADAPKAAAAPAAKAAKPSGSEA
ncbi:MAG TPA: hypothetical protein VFB02_13870 [Bradyrhizobium sp.]|nr:hypothetical protein [Bradyrhizobium sp.]